MDNQQERLLSDLGWLAGVFESEGWFSITKNTPKQSRTGKRYTQYLPQAGITNTDPKFIRCVQDILLDHKIEFLTTKPRITGFGSKPKEDICLQGQKRVKPFLELLLPYMKTKRTRASIILDYINYRQSLPRKAKVGDKENEYWKKVSVINNKNSIKRILRDQTPSPRNG